MMRPGRIRLLLLLFFAAISSNAWLTTTHHSGLQRSRNSEISAHIQKDERYPRGEVIGSSGKIGSFILNSINSPVVPIVEESNNHQYPQCQPAAATPRGVSPGCLSPVNTPLYACIPSSAIRTVWDATVPHRRKDLVFLCNCIPSRHLNFDSSSDFTICILHFGVSHASVDDKGTASSSQPLPILNTSPQSPATVVYGRHATTLAEVLKRDGISVEIASSAQHLQIVAAKKLAWSSLFWLLCHDSNDEPMTVKEVWESKSKQIHELVEEMLPALERLASEPWTKHDDTELPKTLTNIKSIGTVQEVVDYLYAYSMSMKDGKITPSLRLGLNEIQERNEVLLSLMAQSSDDTDRANLPQLQLEMIQRVAGEESLERCLATAKTDDGRDGTNYLERVSCKASNLQFLYYPTKKNARLKTNQLSVIIVGAGIIGSSLAHHLSRRGDLKVTVLDKSTNLLPKTGATDEDDDIYPGVATSSSFAWLNANDKFPLSYMQLNQLGMEMWHRHEMLKEYPVWSGALIRKEKQDLREKNSRYVCVGPLGCDDAMCLEPGIDFKNDPADKSSEFYFYPEEGFIEPIEVVKGLRVSAQRSGANFIGGAENVSLMRNKDGKVAGVEYATTSDNSKIIRATADLVIIACGANSASPALGIGSEKLPLAKQPGALTYVSSDNYLKQPLKRIFVDTINQTHMLRRSDGTLVIGGGKLIVGGRDSDDDSPEDKELDISEEADSAIAKEMITAAIKSISPDDWESFMESSSENDDDKSFRITSANRPISADGLPVVGLVEEGLYVAVTHSGITLAPLIGELASFEIEESLNAKSSEEILRQERYGFQILDAYRPTRFT
mmetsp:Transcript_15752/g.23382  ORF Transcript_15752/g.23382 Transcript_15752/m.23382 type:complete len:841 (+) Transcript_15752:96-2618(+)